MGRQQELRHLSPNTGKLLVPGARIWWEMHYHAVGEEIRDHVELAIYFYPKGQEPKYRTFLTAFPATPGQRRLGPPGYSAEFHRRDRRLYGLAAPARLENFQPHMHLRGKAMLLEAILPDGSKRTLSYVDHFNFNWMTNYIYADDAAPVLPKGTLIHVVAWHDNTANNPNNPDPDQWVGWGERTVDEMAHAWVNVTYISEDDYQAWLAKQPTRRTRSQRSSPHVRESPHASDRMLSPDSRCRLLLLRSSGSNCEWGRRTIPAKASRPLLKAGFANRGRHLQHPVRLFQPEYETGIGYPHWPGQQDRAGRSRSRPAHAFPDAAANWGVFTVTVPKDFGSKKLVWTITANGVTTEIPASLAELWELAPFRDANGNTPPWIGFEASGPFVNGPRGQSKSLTASCWEAFESSALGRG